MPSLVSAVSTGSRLQAVGSSYRAGRRISAQQQRTDPLLRLLFTAALYDCRRLPAGANDSSDVDELALACTGAWCVVGMQRRRLERAANTSGQNAAKRDGAIRVRLEWEGCD